MVTNRRKPRIIKKDQEKIEIPKIRNGSKTIKVDKSLVEILDRIKSKISENMYGVLDNISYSQATRVLAAKINENKFV